jgi:hypothetical protein
MLPSLVMRGRGTEREWREKRGREGRKSERKTYTINTKRIRKRSNWVIHH